VATRDVFSEEELAQLHGFPEAVPGDLIRYFLLSTAEEAFVRKFRSQATRWAPAVQLCTLPWLEFVPDKITSAPRPQWRVCRRGWECRSGSFAAMAPAGRSAPVICGRWRWP
jgi:hypothetical protein